MESNVAELQPQRIVMTAELLHERIAVRFAGRGLVQVAWQVRRVAGQAVAETVAIQQPVRWIRGVTIGLIIIMASVVLKLLFHLRFTDADGWEMLGGIEAGINTVVYLGVGLLFFVTLEQRLKRRKALRAIQELRALAHVIDMHQLSKDPEWFHLKESSPLNDESQHLGTTELTRYLDYCTDLLALLGKTAAVYAQNMQDGVVLKAVDEIETLTTSLSRKIWQKIIILDAQARRSVAESG